MASATDEAPAEVRTLSGRRPASMPWKLLARGALVGVALVFLGEATSVLFGKNLHAVIAGRVYRSAQLSASDLDQVIARYGIRTVINLRGCSVPIPWYLDECRVTQRRGVSQEDVCLSSSRLPSTTEIKRLLEVLDHSETPILLHCRRGADRTGLASAIVLLLQGDTPYATARRQLGIRYGHLAIPPPSCLDRFFTMYEDWLVRQGSAHTPALMRRWLEHDYCPGECRARLKVLDAPATLSAGEPQALRVRCENTGAEPWRLRKDASAGVHAGFFVYDEQDRYVTAGRAGMFDAQVAPGEACEVTVVLPALKKPGRYRLLFDMIDEQQCWFFQVGSEPLERELVVRD